MNNHTHISPNVNRIKRTFDIAVAISLLALLWPFLILISVLVKVSSNGPIIYRQRRLGRICHDRTEFFEMY